MSIYLGLGSNDGARRDNLNSAIDELKKAGFRISRCSSIIESPAMLPDKADASWDRPYLNCAVVGETSHSPRALLEIIKQIEVKMGRDLKAPRWSPRPIDIDILFSDKQQISTPELTIPHSGIIKRDFVLTPLLELRPDLKLYGNTVLTHSQSIKPIPHWMGILNATPDSFSDGGGLDDTMALGKKIESWLEAGVQIFDIGAESTRPRGAQSKGDEVTPEEEWQRLKPALKLVDDLRGQSPLCPLISIDTRHAETAKRALDYGADWLNDVTGLIDIDMIRLVKKAGVPVVAMHSLSVPVNPEETLSTEEDVVEQVLDWLDERLEIWQEAGLDLNQIIFDPGIGFGKTPLQNLALLSACDTLRAQRFRLLVGHSRKSFMNGFTASGFADRDMETLGISLNLCQQGVDIIRCHDPVSHIQAYRAWSHVTGNR